MEADKDSIKNLAEGLSVIDSIKYHMRQGKTLDEALAIEVPEVKMDDPRYPRFKQLVQEHLNR